MSSESPESSIAAVAGVEGQVVVAGVEGQVIDFDRLLGGAHPLIARVENQNLFKEIGRSCHAIETERKNVTAMVQQLRSKGITLDNWASFQVAKMLIQQTYRGVQDRTLDKYTGHLRSYLKMPAEHLPEYICISASVRYWYSAGDEVDVQDKGNNWWHGVVLEVTRRKLKVFWVGFPQSPGGKGKVKNPEFVDKELRCIRMHEEGADVLSGDAERFDAAWILGTEFARIQPQSFREEEAAKIHDNPDSNSETVENESSEMEESQRVAEKNAAAQKNAALAAKKRKAEAARNALAAKKQQKKATDSAASMECETDSDSNSDSAESEQGHSMEDESAASSSDSKQDSIESDSEQACPPRSSDSMQDSSESDSEQDCPPLYELAQVLNAVDESIETLVCLDSGLPPNPGLYDDCATKLTLVASFLTKMYSNIAYNDLVSSTLEELRDYAGQQEPRRFHSKAFLAGLSKYGFCISPRMWKKEEILCIAISVLDPRLDFQGINQKDGAHSKTSFRGMAVLNSTIQRIFYKRLRDYGFVNPRYHPERLQAFSSVVINGGGSWQQSSTWEFCKQSRFKIDTTAAPFIVSVSSDVGALETAGVYVASTTKKNGKPVYVQVSRKEFQGFSGQKGFRSCLKEEWESQIEVLTTNSTGKRVDACSPRLLVCLNADQSEWGIQLLPGFGSEFCILKFAWSKNQTSNMQRFASFNFHNFEAKMQACALSITSLCASAAACLNSDALNHGHAFSFGTAKIVRSDFLKKSTAASFKVSPLRPQGWHSDGPRKYDDSVFDMFGNLRPDAKACAKRKAWPPQKWWNSLWENPLHRYLTDHIDILQQSFSALFGIFKGTYIETPASSEAERGVTALKVPVPLGCAVIFTFAWKHRGKGDDPNFSATRECPVPVHARPHFYAYSSDIRKLPSVDCETSLEFISICSLSGMNRGSQSQILDCLQTFDRTSAPGHHEDPDVHYLFPTQRDLDRFVTSQLEERFGPEEAVETPINCRKWYLSLDASQRVQLQFCSVDEEAAARCVTITSANFDSEKPSFRDSEGTLYTVIEKPAVLDTWFRVGFKGPDVDFGGLCLGPAASANSLRATNEAMQALFENWCESSLLRLLSILDLYAIKDCTLTIALGPKDQSGHKYVLLLEGVYQRDSQGFKEYVRPDCEGVAELYRECLKLLVMMAGSVTTECIHDGPLSEALTSLEQSSGLFNVGLENVLESLEISVNDFIASNATQRASRTLARQRTPRTLAVCRPHSTLPFVFMLGTRYVMLTEPIVIVYKIPQNLDDASAPKRAREESAATTGVSAAPRQSPSSVKQARRSTGQPAQRQRSSAGGGGGATSSSEESDAATTGVSAAPRQSPLSVRFVRRSTGKPAQRKSSVGLAQGGGVGGGGAISWERVPQVVCISRADAWARVAIKPAERLPRASGTNLPINHNCVDCRGEQFCKTHNRMMTRVDLTELHMRAMKESGYCLVECGGGGDCFYHSMLFLSRLHNMEDLVDQWKDHSTFRTSTCEKLKTEDGRPILLYDPALNTKITFLDRIVSKRVNDEPQSPEDTLSYFIRSHKQSETPNRSGTYVENEMIHAVAFQNDITILVAHPTVPGFQVILPNGSANARPDDRAAVDSPFFLWCTGGHYQAFVKIHEFEVLSTALQTFPFIESSLLQAEHFRLKE